ncbi:MAG: hypothetical protein [Caudoviricetes sp.]|nr:MAG: hypothetical protein [Caudoviricetes sp.]
MLCELYKVKGEVVPLDDDILAIEMETGLHKMASGIILPDDNGKNRGIRPRWCKIFKIGKNVTEVQEGDMALVEHGRWTYRHLVEIENEDGSTREIHLQKIDPKGIYGTMNVNDFDKNDLFSQVGKAIEINGKER